MSNNVKVCILDYGSGNVSSVLNRLRTLTPSVEVSNSPESIAQATHLILPGVGAFGSAMEKIRDRIPLRELQTAILEERKPFLGICVGMQVLATTGTEFGEHPGLGWIDGRVEVLETHGVSLPHIGWNSVEDRGGSPLFRGLDDRPDFYFVHSFALKPDCAQGLALAYSEYGSSFVAAVRRENLFGVQFHPEKSQTAGKKLLQNFLEVS